MSADAFQHGVASGDPLTDRVVIWTRVSSGDSEVPVDWTVARDQGLSDVVASGQTTARAERDHTLHVDVDGLEPGATYFYGFAAAGESSPVGRTWTLRDDPDRVRFAICSCAKFNAGFFNAYARMAARDDLDFLLHLGDYIYEASNKPPKTQTPGADIGRPFEPEGECRTLEEYRTRYAQYRRDPDVQALHRTLPMIGCLDDHELADGAWAGGSDAHDPAEHGPWGERRDAAFQARWEWLPARPPDPADPTRVFRTVALGELAAIHIVDIRSRRDQPALPPRMSDPDRSMLGAAQRQWLLEALAEGARPAWTVLASPAILTRTWVDDPQEPLRTAVLKLKLMDEDGEGADEDQWDGYPAERERLLAALREIDDVLVLSGDIHISLASEVRDANGTVAAEFTTPSLTSQNLDEKIQVAPRSDEILAAERAYVDGFDHVHWAELASHGYVVVDIDPDRARGEWWLLDTVLERSDSEQLAAAFEVPRGRSALREVGRQPAQ